MKRILVVALLGLLTGAFAVADTISGGTLTAFPAGFAATTGTNNVQGNPFWNDASLDGTQRNVGYFLTGSGGFTGGTNFAPTTYLSNGTANPVNAPTAFNFVRTNSALTISLLGSFSGLNTGANGDILGWYATDATGTVHGADTVLYSNLASAVGTSTAFNPTQFYGFFIDSCIVTAGGVCTGTRARYYTNSAFNLTAENISNHQHFAAFGLANLAAGSETFFLGSEDQPNTNGLEAYGDFNDAIFRISAVAIPEPATLGLIGASLAGLALVIRRRNRK